jgi:isopenicillin-N N-acyltransferase-like protein
MPVAAGADLPVPFVVAHGDPFAVGQQHGAARAAALRAFLDDDLARLNKVLPEPTSLPALAPTLAAYRAQLERQLPAQAEEIRGLAAGAGVSEDEALLLQLRRELAGYQRIPTMGDCTTYARSADTGAEPVLVQTVDLYGDLEDQITILDVALQSEGRHSLVLTFGGLLGYLGVNSDGLAVGLNLVLSGDWHPGVPPYLAIRHLLDTCATVEDALAELRRLELASSRSLTLCDRRTAVAVEFVDGPVRVVDRGEVAHTNHFLDPDFAGADELNVFARNSSLQRLKACRAALEDLPPRVDPEEHFAILSAPPICVPDLGDVRREHTVAAVVLYPERGELHVRPGDPSQHATQSFSFAGGRG